MKNFIALLALLTSLNLYGASTGSGGGLAGQGGSGGSGGGGTNILMTNAVVTLVMLNPNTPLNIAIGGTTPPLMSVLEAGSTGFSISGGGILVSNAGLYRWVYRAQMAPTASGDINRQFQIDVTRSGVLDGPTQTFITSPTIGMPMTYISDGLVTVSSGEVVRPYLAIPSGTLLSATNYSAALSLFNMQATGGGGGGAGDISTTASNNIIAQIVAGDAAVSNASLQGVIPIESYGAKGDGIRLLDATLTAGSAVINSASASFTQADVGKLIAIFYDKGTNQFYDLNIISSVQSGTQLTMTTVATNTVTITSAMVWYGTDNTTFIQAAANGNKNINVGSGVYLIGGPYVQRQNAEFSIITFPAHFIRGNTNNAPSVRWDGVAPGHWIITAQNNPAPIDGSIFFALTKSPAVTNAGFIPSVFGCASDAQAVYGFPGDFAMEAYEFTRMNFRTPFRSGRTFMNFLYAGGFSLKDVQFGVEYPPLLGGNANGNGYFITPGNKNGTNGIALIGPGVSNNGKIYLENVSFLGYPVGMVVTEHHRMNNVAVECCDIAYITGHLRGTHSTYSGTGADIYSGQVITVSNAVFAVPDDVAEFRLHANIENENGPQVPLIDAPKDVLTGYLSANYSLGTWGVENQRGLQFNGAGSDALTAGGFGDPWAKLPMKTSSEIGTTWFAGGLIFDIAFNDNWNTFNTSSMASVSDRSSYAWRGIIGDTPRTWIAGPSGGAIHINGTGGGLRFSTNCCRGLGSNCTFNIWYKTTVANSAILFKFFSSPDGEFWFTTYDNVRWDIRLVNVLGQQWAPALSGLTTNNIDGNWHNVGLTYDSTNVTLFMDGLPFHTSTFTNAINMTANETVFLGSGVQNADIGRTRVWTRALTAAEMLKLYQEVSVSPAGSTYTKSTYFLNGMTNGMVNGDFRLANSNGWPVMLWISNSVFVVKPM